MDIVNQISSELTPKKDLPKFKSGDNITVFYTIKEGNKQRTQFLKEMLFKEKVAGPLKRLQ